MHRWLAAFHAVACAGGFTAGAKILNVGQPTISTHVRALEDHFRVELFLRQGRTVSLTAIGRSLLEVTQNMFGHEGEALTLLRAAGSLEAGGLRIGASGPYDVMELIAKFRACHPKVQLSVQLGTAEDVLEQLLKFEVDVGVIGHEQKQSRFHTSFYSRHRVLVTVNRSHSLARQRTIRIEQLEGEDVVLRSKGSTTRQAFEEALRVAKVTVRPTMEINSREAVREAVILSTYQFQRRSIVAEAAATSEAGWRCAASRA